jgi:hypothetical protein
LIGVLTYFAGFRLRRDAILRALKFYKDYHPYYRKRWAFVRSDVRMLAEAINEAYAEQACAFGAKVASCGRLAPM